MLRLFVLVCFGFLMNTDDARIRSAKSPTATPLVKNAVTVPAELPNKESQKDSDRLRSAGARFNRAAQDLIKAEAEFHEALAEFEGAMDRSLQCLDMPVERMNDLSDRLDEVMRRVIKDLKNPSTQRAQ